MSKKDYPWPPHIESAWTKRRREQCERRFVLLNWILAFALVLLTTGGLALLAALGE